jgi:hypothetical protein
MKYENGKDFKKVGEILPRGVRRVDYTNSKHAGCWKNDQVQLHIKFTKNV